MDSEKPIYPKSISSKLVTKLTLTSPSDGEWFKSGGDL